MFGLSNLTTADAHFEKDFLTDLCSHKSAD